MEKFKSILDSVWQYIKTRGWGFYLLLPVVILSVAESLVYNGGFGPTPYFTVQTFVLPFMTIPLLLAAFFRPTAKYAPVAMYAIEFISLLLFIQATYMHLSSAFFGGVSNDILEQAGFHFSFCVIALVINMILCIISIFAPQYRKTASAAGTDKAQEV